MMLVIANDDELDDAQGVLLVLSLSVTLKVVDGRVFYRTASEGPRTSGRGAARPHC